MKRTYRLRRPDQFQRVRREGHHYTNPFFLLNVAPNRRRRSRCGFVVGKRIGNAVQRNRAKRRVREAVRLLFAHIANGIDLVVVVRRQEVLALPFCELQESLVSLLRRAGVWLEGTITNDTVR